jgi:hypothetical protein
MPTKEILELHKKFKNLVDNRKFKEAKIFLSENILKFPEEQQRKIRLFLFEDSLRESLRSDDKVITQFQIQGLKLSSDLEDIDKSLDEKLETIKIQKSIKTK